jgi:3-hydroxyisobutyrate dehydrogenase-like beta-hydroxyacid dehydrogenase
LGEAGTIISSDLVAAGLSVNAYDPAPVSTPAGVSRFEDPGKAVVGVDAVIALTASGDAAVALEQSFDQIPQEALYADFSTASAGLKRKLAEKAATRDIAFADIALLAIVPGNGIQTRALAAGTGADRFVATFSPLGMPVESLGENAGDAATRKLLRSVFMKGLAAVTIEALRGAEQVGLSEWLWQNLAAEIEQADGAWLRRLVEGSKIHAARRLDEMEASSTLLRELEVRPLMTDSTVESLTKIMSEGLPVIPSTKI